MSWAVELLALRLGWRRLDNEVQAGQGLSLFVGLLGFIFAGIVSLVIFFLSKFNQDVPAVSQSWLILFIIGYFSFGLLWGLATVGRQEQGIWRYSSKNHQQTADIFLAIIIAVLATVFTVAPLYLGRQADLIVSWQVKVLALTTLTGWDVAAVLIGIASSLIIRRVFGNFLIRAVVLFGLVWLGYWLGTYLIFSTTSLIWQVLFGGNLTALLVLAVAIVCLVASASAICLLILTNSRINQRKVSRYWFFRLGDSSYFASFNASSSAFITGLLLQLRDRVFQQRIILILLLGTIIGFLKNQFPTSSTMTFWLLGMIWAILALVISFHQGVHASMMFERHPAWPIQPKQTRWGFWWSALVTILPVGLLLTAYLLGNFVGGWLLLTFGLFGLICHALSCWIGHSIASRVGTRLGWIAQEGIGVLVLATTGLLALILALFLDATTPLLTSVILLIWAIGMALVWVGFVGKIALSGP